VLKLQAIESHYVHVIGKDNKAELREELEKAELREELEVLRTTGLWAYRSEKADKGWTETKVLAPLKKLAAELPGCKEIAR